MRAISGYTNQVSLLLYLDIPPHIVADFRKISLHTGSVLVVDNLQKFLQLGANLCHLIVGVWVEEDFLQKIIVLVEHTFGYSHVAFKGCSGCVLMLHYGSEHESGDEGDTQ